MQTRQEQIDFTEEMLGVKFPQSYRQFLLEQGSAFIAGQPVFGLPEEEPKEEKQGTVLSFRPGDPRKGSFDWISFYENRVVGLCNKPNCDVCNLTEREKLKDFQGGELRVNLIHYQRVTREFYIAHLVSVPEEEVREQKPKISVLRATEELKKRRSDLSSRKLVVVSSKRSSLDGKEKALCIDTEKIQGGEAPLIEVSDINQQGAKCFPALNSFKEYLECLRRLEEEDKAFFAARRRLNNRNDELREKELSRFIGRVFGNKCPVCEKRERRYLVCQQCFKVWGSHASEKTTLAVWVQENLERKGINVRKFTHKGGKEVQRIHARAQDWHSRIFRVMDYAVGLTAFRHNYQFNCLEVDEFWSADPYGFKKGQAVRNLTMAILSEANSLSGSLEIVFTRDVREDEQTGRLLKRGRKERVFRPVPQELVKMAQDYDVSIAETEQGRISHQEGVEIFTRAFELPSRTLEEIDKLERGGYLTKEAVCSVITAGRTWSREQVIWFFDNASRPEAVILGTDLPENRIFHADSLNYGRSVLLAERFQKVVLVEITDGFSSEERATPECSLEPRGQFWMLKSAEGFELPWTLEKEKIWISPKEPVLIFSRPRIISSKEENLGWIRKNTALLEEAKRESGAKTACLIINYEFISRDFGQDPEAVKEINRDLAKKGIHILVPYERCDQMDLEVEGRMKTARKMRQFPPRPSPLALQIAKIPFTEWEKNKTLGHLAQNAYDYGRLVAKRIETGRYRSDFIITSGAVERVALCNPQREDAGTLRGERSSRMLKALEPENNVFYSFVRPQGMPALQKAFQEFNTTSEGVGFGIIMFPVPYERVETPIVQAETPRIRVEIPETIKADIEQKKERRIKDDKYVSCSDWIESARQQMEKALGSGLPLAVSYLQPQSFVETIRDYVYYRLYTERRREPFLWVFKRWRSHEKREPEKPARLRIIYGDGTEGQPFSLFLLRKDFQLVEQLYELPAQILSLRHMLCDYATEVSIIRNIEIQRKEDSAEQEDFAFRKVYSFIETFLKLIQGEISLDEAVDNYGLIFRVLWQGLSLDKEVPKQGLKLHLFQSTGLEPAIIGAYRAVVSLLEKYQGRLVVVPRIYRPDGELQKEFEGVPMSDNQEKRRIVSEMYPPAIQWY